MKSERFVVRSSQTTKLTYIMARSRNQGERLQPTNSFNLLTLLHSIKHKQKLRQSKSLVNVTYCVQIFYKIPKTM